MKYIRRTARLKNHIGFSPKQVTGNHIPGGYVPSPSPAFIFGNFSQIPRDKPAFRSFEGTVVGRIEVEE